MECTVDLRGSGFWFTEKKKKKKKRKQRMGPDPTLLYMCMCVYSGLTSLSTIFQSYHDGVWLRQGAQCSPL